MPPHATRPLRRVLVVALLVLGPAARGAEPVPDALRAELKLAPFYQRHADAGGLPVVGSAKVSDHALAEAAWVVGKMLGDRPDVLKAMRANRVRVAVMAATEYTTDLPEHANMKPKLYWDRRARGLGATRSNPVVSCGEENLLGHQGDPYPAENIFVHEFAHAIHGTGLSTTDPTFDRRLRAAYQAARDRGLWKNTYAATNAGEYWAEGVQCWFDDNAPPDALHNDVRTRAGLKEYDAGLAGLCREVFGDGPWRYRRPAARPPEERAHLPGYDRAKLPRFEWRKVPVGDAAKVTVQTAAGDFELVVDAKAAPEAARLFLAVAEDGGYHSGRLRGAAGVVRGTAAAGWLTRGAAERLKLPTVPASTARPAEGTIALVRGGAVGEFVLFPGTVPEAVGDVVPCGRIGSGADVVRAVLTRGETIDLRRVIRTE
ncbi:hypothetical protein [Urbifossiella limnaea]|uniref:PPIase cyclophilin-type domain-containing protein n=1 Tax=Urbifossiella limnaea TaxID=2528023 RepID=A0A517XPM6_9BACT|nr:hypothetical protein [Urbifossiella limnaea]QDU19461.1 hypothetical protein ETAA1_13860 [Urbifossiella limnaea]